MTIKRVTKLPDGRIVVKNEFSNTGYEVIRPRPGKNYYNLAGGRMFCMECMGVHEPYGGE